MKVGICIVHYGEQKLLDDCLKSLYDGGVKRFEVGMDRAVFEESILNCNKNNLGFTAGNNQLIVEFLNGSGLNKFDWIWLLNNDTVVPKETLESIEKLLPTLTNGLLDLSNIGVIGFKILSLDNSDLIHHGGTIECYPAGIHKSGSVKLKQLNKRTYEKWVTFASVLIRREVFETVGLLDNRFFNYFSDSDFCYRARNAGFKVIYEPSFVISHKIGQSQNPSPEQIKILQSDSIKFQDKWINGKNFFDLEKELIVN